MQNTSLLVKSIICIAIVMGFGFASGLSTANSITEWYSTLNKPFFSPPNWIFGPAWTILYILIGISIARIWHFGKGHASQKTVITIFIIQMILNLIWSPVFFSMKQPIIAIVIITLLWFMIIMYIRKSKEIDKTASLLFIPYLLWVSFATMLNAGIIYLN